MLVRIQAMRLERLSDVAKDVTRQIFAGRVNEIFLMRQSRPVRLANVFCWDAI